MRLVALSISGGGFASSHFLPFLAQTRIQIDPWTQWIASDGRSDAFPYGLVLFGLLSMLSGVSTQLSSWVGVDLSLSVFIFVILFVDFLVWRVLRRVIGDRGALAYFLSPLVIYINFYLLQTDIFVGLFMLLFSLSFISGKGIQSGLFLGLAVGCKIGFALVFPFVLLYLVFNPRARLLLIQTMCVSVSIIFISYLPALWSSGFRDMTFGTDRIFNLVELKLDMGPFNLYLFPLTFILLCIWIYKKSRSSLTLVPIFMCSALFGLSLLSTSALGWFLWSIPVIVLLNDWRYVKDVILFTLLGFLFILADYSYSRLQLPNFDETSLSDLIPTFSLLAGMIWLSWFALSATRRADPLNFVARPLSIALGGDSGVGKDLIASEISSLLDSPGIAMISGDSFHRRERGHGVWTYKTHLHPDQNRLDEWQGIVRRFLRRETVSVPIYDHTTGRFSPLIRISPSDILINQGLHAIKVSKAEQFDLLVFIEMQERLRKMFKVSRDVSIRRQKASDIVRAIEKRRLDYELHIQPHKAEADIIVHQGSLNPNGKVVDFISYSFTNSDLAFFIQKSLSLFSSSLTIRESGEGHILIEINHLGLINPSTLSTSLETHMPALKGYFPSIGTVQKVSSGLTALICILSASFKRLQSR